MRITDSEVIKSGEKDLIDAITGDLDWGAIEEIFRRDHKLGIGEDVECKKGDIVVYNNQVAYRLEFDVKVALSVLLDREGNYVSVTSLGDVHKTNEADENGMLGEPEEQSTPGDNTESENGYEKAMAEIDQSDHPENSDMVEQEPLAEDSEEKISRVASQAGDIIAEMDDDR
ncbi:MAG: hypothetical protein JRD02_02970 [Deltaproteobacteria bacterium]|nr:hypothetical protein [Deltaproteobacteria bacterium]